MIEQLFKQGNTVKEISKILNLKQKDVSLELNRLGYKRYLSNPKKALLIKEVAKEYSEFNSLTKLGKKYDLNLKLLSEEIKDLGIQIINYHNLVKFDEHIFDTIDTKEKAY